MESKGFPFIQWFQSGCTVGPAEAVALGVLGVFECSPLAKSLSAQCRKQILKPTATIAIGFVNIQNLPYVPPVSLITLEVEIDHGRVKPRGTELLPERAIGLLTLLPDPPSIQERGSIGEFVAKWAGEFTPRSNETGTEDPRLEYLLQKHLRPAE